MATPEAQARTYLDAATTSIESSDYPGARKNLTLANIQYAKIPEEEDQPGIGDVKNRMLKEIKELFSMIDVLENDDTGRYKPVRNVGRVV